MRHRTVLVVVLVALELILMAGAAPVEARSSTCPAQPLTVRDLNRLEDEVVSRVSTFASVNVAALRCFAGRDIRIRAFADEPDGIGGTDTFVIHPLWLTNSSLYLFASSREVAPGFGAGRYTAISVPPALGRVDKRFHRRWVEVTAHYDDPIAGRCHATGLRSTLPTRAQSIATCRAIPVLSSVRAISGPDAPDTATVSAGAASPSDGSVARGVLLLAAAGLGVGLWRLRTGSRTRERPGR
jgi:hypothetical protein